MRKIFSTGLASLIVAYLLSQFYRTFLAVLSPALQQEIGAGPEDLALSLGLWYIAFGLTQIPVGWALDRWGPRETVAVLLALGAGGGAVVFAFAQSPLHIHIAMALLGMGCAPVMVSSLFIFARTLPLSATSTASGLVIGLGSLGNMLGSAPLVWLTGQIGWRAALEWLALLTLAVAALVYAAVRNPAKPESGRPTGSLRELLKLRGLWPILPLLFVTNAAPACVRGLWSGPYLDEVFGASDYLIGWVTLAMGIAMVSANLSLGRVRRTFGTDKWPSVINTVVACVMLAVLWLIPSQSLALSAVLLVVVSLSDSNYSLVMSHGRSFLPPHLVGRGITFLNMFAMGGVGVMQFASRPVYLKAADHDPAPVAYSHVFLFFLVTLAIGLVIYLFSAADDKVNVSN